MTEPTEDQVLDALIMLGDPVALAKRRIAEYAEANGVIFEWFFKNMGQFTRAERPDARLRHPSGGYRFICITPEIWDRYDDIKKQTSIFR